MAVNVPRAPAVPCQPHAHPVAQRRCHPGDGRKDVPRDAPVGRCQREWLPKSGFFPSVEA